MASLKLAQHHEGSPNAPSKGIDTAFNGEQNLKTGGSGQCDANTQHVTDVSGDVAPNEADSQHFGIGSWHPHCLQRLVNPVVFVVLLCLFTICDAFFSGIQVALLTTLETRYGLSAYQIGMVVTINKIGTMLGLPVAAYLGGRPNTHRPRWIAASAFLMAFGMIATCIPQFIFEPYQYHHSQFEDMTESVLSDDYDLCSASTNYSSTSSYAECTESTSLDDEAAYIIILISQFVAGVGYAPTRPLGISYIDDNVKPNRAGFYLGIVSSMYGIGVVLGFLASSAASLIWVDFYRTQTTLTHTDKAWVSAWWLLFIFVAFILVLSGIPFLGYPKQLPRKWRIANDDVDSAVPDDSKSSEPILSTLKLGGIKALLNSLLRVLTNGSYLLASFAFVTSGLITGLLSFFPKYIESQFGLPTSLVNILVAIMIPALGLGSILGGYLCRRWKLQVVGQTKLCLACVCTAAVFQVLLFVFGCDNQSIAGINDDFGENRVAIPNLTSSCNMDCNCRHDTFQMVCFQAEQITYMSPCFAGCTQKFDAADSMQFVNCSCLHVDDLSSSDVVQNATSVSSVWAVVKGACAYQCNTLIPFVICVITFVFIFSTEGAPLILTVVRSVDTRDKTFAYGITKCLQYVIERVTCMYFDSSFSRCDSNTSHNRQSD
ncbi:solute carrier organic anion transporter family member 5A1-like isoform X2 [Patiria miniata]|uniref:Solute carrier organic anion transporter family member n=1 Tax=Patiria miniata TaxID=46514 RepID=A0A914A974_PATMI|nr:solute carrier organic anion transporter family member 5A1-like isoform X2 [Patiria miniata]